MSEDKELIESRNLRKAKYAIEDFAEAINGLKKVSLVHVVLVVALAFSVFMGAKNIVNIIFSLVTIAALLGLRASLSFHAKEMVYMGIVVYYIILILELVIGGTPDTIIPSIGLDNISTRSGLVKLLNGISPFVYLGCRVLMGFSFLVILQKLNALKKIPVDLLKKHNFHMERY